MNSAAPSANHSVIKMEDLKIDRNGFLKLLKELKMNKATGPDGISARTLKETADAVADPPLQHIQTDPFCNIFKQTLKFGTVPDDWRHANVTPI